jgi:hypothetical protein
VCVCEIERKRERERDETVKNIFETILKRELSLINHLKHGPQTQMI